MQQLKRIFAPNGDVYLLTAQNRGGTPTFTVLTSEEEIEECVGKSIAKVLGIEIHSDKAREVIDLLRAQNYNPQPKPKVMPTRDIYLLNMLMRELDAQDGFFDASRFTYRYFSPAATLVSAVAIHDTEARVMAVIIPDESAAGQGLLITVGRVEDFDHRNIPLPGSEAEQAFYLGKPEDLTRGAMELAAKLGKS